MRTTTVRRGVAAASALLGAATMALVATSPASAQPHEWETCDSYQSRELRQERYLRVPSTEDEELRCVLRQGDSGDGVRVLKTALRECYEEEWLEDDDEFDDQTRRALRRVQRQIGDEGREGVYTPRTRRAGMEFAVFDSESDWDTTGRCRAWEHWEE